VSYNWFCCVCITVAPKDSKWSGRVDSHGFRILQDQVVNVQQLTQEQVLLILKDGIIHEDGIYTVMLSFMFVISGVYLIIYGCFKCCIFNGALDNFLQLVKYIQHHFKLY